MSTIEEPSPTAADTAQSRRLPVDFWRLWTSTASSNLGDGVRLTALPLLAAAIDPRPLVVATLSALGYLPWLVFSLVAGGVADRVDRRRLMMRLQVFRVVVIGIFAIAEATSRVDLAGLFALAVVMGVAEVFFDSTAVTAPPAVMPASQLERGNSRLYSAEITANEFVGSPLGAALFAWRAAAPFWFALVGNAVSCLALSRVRVSFNPPTPAADVDAPPDRDPLLRSIRVGVRITASSPFLRAWTVTLAAANFSRAMTVSIFVLYVLQLLHGGQIAYGVLSAAVAAGGLVGGWGADRVIARLGRPASTIAGVAAVILSDVLLGLVPSTATAGLAGVLFGAGIGVSNVVFVSARQKVVPAELLGRVASVQRFIAWGALPLGALLGGWLAQTAGLRAPYLGAAALVAGLFLLFIRPLLDFPDKPITVR